MLLNPLLYLTNTINSIGVVKSSFSEFIGFVSTCSNAATNAMSINAVRIQSIGISIVNLAKKLFT